MTVVQAAPDGVARPESPTSGPRPDRVDLQRWALYQLGRTCLIVYQVSRRGLEIRTRSAGEIADRVRVNSCCRPRDGVVVVGSRQVRGSQLAPTESSQIASMTMEPFAILPAEPRVGGSLAGGAPGPGRRRSVHVVGERRRGSGDVRAVVVRHHLGLPCAAVDVSRRPTLTRCNMIRKPRPLASC
jgi:hypothetical protein